MSNDTKDSKDKKNKKPDLKKPKFSPYWIYGSIFVIFLALQFSGGSNFSQTQKTSQAAFETKQVRPRTPALRAGLAEQTPLKGDWDIKHDCTVSVHERISYP